MPRIRSLKPEHRSHRKIGPLSDRAYRLWVGMLLEADDAGRLVCDTAQLRAVIFAYHPKVSAAMIEAALRELTGTGLVRTYCVSGSRYACFPSWQDHQKIDHPRHSTLPDPALAPDGGNCSDSNDSTNPREDSRNFAPDRTRSDRIGSEGIKDRITTTAMSSPLDAAPLPLAVKDWSTAKWPSPEALAHLFNELAPDNVPAVETLSPTRRKRARARLLEFPDRAWWVDALNECRHSKFLSGQTAPRPGHEHWTPSFDWFLANARNGGSENCVRVHDGEYR